MSLSPRRNGLLALSLLLGAGGVAPACTAPEAPATAAAPPPWEWTPDEIRAAVDPVRAGRDLTPPAWPGGSRVAVLFSVDVDNETLFLRNTPLSVGQLSQGEYGARRAMQRLVDLVDRERIPTSFFIPIASLVLAPEQAELMARSGLHEVGVHGWIHERPADLDRETERRLTLQSLDFLEEVTGVRPVGYRAPAWDFSPNTLDILLELGFLYDSSLMADDRPYELLARGAPTGLIELPVEWILDDWPLLNPLGTRYSTPDEVLKVWKDEFDRAWEEGTTFILAVHPHVIGQRSRIRILEELFRYMKSREGVWFATHQEVAEFLKAGL